MRVEVRLEQDEREWTVIVECDRASSPKHAFKVATEALEQLVNEPFILPHQR